MKTKFLILPFFISGLVFSQGTWMRKADFPASSRNNAVSFSIGKRGYYGLGQKQMDVFKFKVYQDFWEYDPQTNSWRQRADFPVEPRLGMKGFAVKEKGYAGFGYYIEAYGPNAGGNNYQPDFYEFIPDSNKWFKKNNNYLADHDICFLLHDTLWSINVDYKLLKRYNPANDSWSEFKLGKKPSAPYYSEVMGSDADFISGGNEYIMTCFRKKRTYVNQLWEFNPHSLEWILKNNLPPDGNDTLISFMIDKRVFVLRGKNNLLEYNAELDSWTERKEILPQKNFIPAFTVGAKSYFISQHEFWEYTP